MSKNDDDAMLLAEQLAASWKNSPSAAHIRRLVAENEAQAALLRQAEQDGARYRWLRDALVSDDPYGWLQQAFGHLDKNQVPTAEDFDKGIDAAIRQHLEGKP